MFLLCTLVLTAVALYLVVRWAGAGPPVLSGPPFAGPNKIVLKTKAGRYDEGHVGTAFYPGMLLSRDFTTNPPTLAPHAVAGGLAEQAYAIENPFQSWTGSIISTAAVVSDDGQPYFLGLPGDEIFALVQGGTAAIAVNDKLTSNGDGTLKTAAGTNFVIAEAIDAIDNSAASNAAWFRVRLIAVGQLS